MKPAGDGEVRARRRRALAIYFLLTAVFLATTPRERRTAHTPFNHHALVAEAWLAGRLDLGGPPPAHAGNNDFAFFEGKHHVSFPPLPALVILPVVALAGRAAAVPDALVWLALAGVGPALLFLALERLRETRRSRRSERDNAALAVLLGLGTVYWFSAVQGTVWFASHVVTMALACAYVRASIGAERPALAGLALGLAVATRPTLLCAAPFFLCEAWRRSRADHCEAADRARALARAALRFAAPLASLLALCAWHNAARFGDPTEFGHRFLTVVWRERIERHGLFSLHYLGRNLSVALTSLPFFTERGVRINGHGLALWLTTPLYVFACWPRRTVSAYWAAAASAGLVALPSLLYQNTGWLQFGYRFSNDFAPFLFLMIALGGRRFGRAFWACALFGIAVNAFGALSFGRPEGARYYFVDPTQRVVHETDLTHP
jgi:hypothetical protein